MRFPGHRHLRGPQLIQLERLASKPSVREAASRFRTALALHQARFAAASIEASEAYDKSAGEVWNAGENFRKTAERILSRA